jgi:hypothetical protein
MNLQARNIAQYLRIVSRLRDEWELPEDDQLWFRAEDAKYYPTRLQPQIFRPRDGAPLKSTKELLKLENLLFEEFRRCATQLSSIDPGCTDNDWDDYFLMQHHEVPTRLLDWSDGALIALHFAVRNKKLPADTDSTIFVLDSDWLNDKVLMRHPDRIKAKKRWRKYLRQAKPSDLIEDDWDRLYLPVDAYDAEQPLLKTPVAPLMWEPHHSTRRIAAQRSRFMIFGTDPDWLTRLADKAGSRLVAITIPKTAISNLRLELRQAGITESVVYPDLDGLGRELKQLWELRR